MHCIACDMIIDSQNPLEELCHECRLVVRQLLGKKKYGVQDVESIFGVTDDGEIIQMEEYLAMEDISVPEDEED